MPDSPLWLEQLAAAEAAGAQGNVRTGHCCDPDCTYCKGLPVLLASRSEITVGGLWGAVCDAVADIRGQREAAE